MTHHMNCYKKTKTRQKTKIKDAFNSNMSTDLRLSRVQISKITQS